MNSTTKWMAGCVATFLGLAVAQAQIVLTPLNPTTLDTSFASTSGANLALIDFVNQESFAVDIFWINYNGDRVFYDTLSANSNYDQPTYLTHPWIVAVYGSGDTLAQGTGTLLDGFLAVTANPQQNPTLADIAIIAPAVAAVPEPSSLALMLAGGAGLLGVVAARRKKGERR